MGNKNAKALKNSTLEEAEYRQHVNNRMQLIEDETKQTQNEIEAYRAKLDEEKEKSQNSTLEEAEYRQHVNNRMQLIEDETKQTQNEIGAYRAKLDEEKEKSQEFLAKTVDKKEFKRELRKVKDKMNNNKEMNMHMIQTLQQTQQQKEADINELQQIYNMKIQLLEAEMEVIQKKIEECNAKSEAGMRESEARVDEIQSLTECLKLSVKFHMTGRVQEGHLSHEEFLDMYRGIPAEERLNPERFGITF